MPITNTVIGAGNNSADQFNLPISDTNTHDLPDTDGDDSAGGDYWDAQMIDRCGVYVQNNQDQALNATLKRIPSGADAVEVADVSSVTVSSGGAEVLVPDHGVPFGQLRVEVTFSTAPTGNNDTVVIYDWERDA